MIDDGKPIHADLKIDSRKIKDDSRQTITKVLDPEYAHRPVYEVVQKLLDPETDYNNAIMTQDQVILANEVRQWFDNIRSNDQVSIDVKIRDQNNNTQFLQLTDKLSKYESSIQLIDTIDNRTNERVPARYLDMSISQISAGGIDYLLK